VKPYLIGVTGNIASGKSVVLQYLENAGALTIDADLIAQDSYLPGNPAWRPILDRFGEDLLRADGQINRSRLGRTVFSDPQALTDLEHIVHPYVFERINALYHSAGTPIVVVEAIKLLETDLANACDEIWTVSAPVEARVQRLIETRGLSEKDARLRVASQSPEEDKICRSQRVISTAGSFQDVYNQVAEHLADILSRNHLKFDYREPWLPLHPEEFNMVLPKLHNAMPNMVALEDIYRLLSRTNLLTDHATIVLFNHHHHLTLLRRSIPFNLEFETKQSILAELNRQAALHQCAALIVNQLWLTKTEAKRLGFEPGDYPLKGSESLIYQEVLRRQGLLPGEVYRKAF